MMLVYDQKTLQAKRYWLQRLGGELPEGGLPPDFPRPPQEKLERVAERVEADADLVELCQKVSRGSEALQHMLWMNALSICIAKYARQEQVLIGTAAPRRAGAQASILPILAEASGEVGFKGLLAKMRQAIREAEEHADYPLEQLAQDLGLPREEHRCPLFDVALVSDRLHDELAFASRVPDLLLIVRNGEQAMQVEAHYAPDLYRPSTIRRLLAHLQQVMRQGLERPEEPICRLELLAADEQAQLQRFNETDAPFPQDRPVHQFFEEQAAKTPDRVAAVFEEDSLTYARLNRKANQLARRLREQGVQADSIVGVLAERSPEMLIGILGILKAGGAYLPITPEFPDDRIRYQLADSGARLVLTQTRFRQRIDFDGTVLCLEEESAYAAEGSDLEPLAAPHDLAYVIYTSGSTGNPKGVMIEHRSVINRLHWMHRAYEIGEADVLLQKTPFVFDVSVWEMFLWSFVGARVVFLPPGGEKSPDTIIETVERAGVTTMHFVPSMLSVFLDAVDDPQKLERLKSLRRVFTSGEALTPKQVTRFTESLGQANGVRLLNLYGPTEATVDVTAYDCTGLLEPDVVPIGRPIDNTKLYVLNAHGQCQPIGVPGELHIGGVNVGRGYLNKPELTAEKFPVNPFTAGERLYKTGDLVRWLPSGDIEFLGRLDFQVKIRGYRIELGEIENALLKHERITDALVLDREGQDGDRYLVAYAVAKEALSSDELRTFLSASLPEYMIPTAFVFLDEMPLTTNGKTDRKRLPEPVEHQMVHAFIAPRTETELRLAAIWAELLGVAQVGCHDHFFHLGGHSLKAAALIARLYRDLRVQVSMREIYGAATLEEMAALLEAKEQQGGVQRIAPLAPAEHYALSSAQRRLYTLQQMEENSTSYNMTSRYRLDGSLDLNRLEAAFRQLIERHEALRTSFSMREGVPVQTVHEEVEFSVQMAQESEATAAERIESWMHQPFDLNQAPLLRVGVVKLADQQHELVVDMHHIISDGVSMEILFAEFVAAYAGESLNPLTIQYKEYADWQNRWLASSARKEQEAFWLGHYADGVPVLDLPTDLPRPAQIDYAGDNYAVAVDRELLAQVRAFAKAQGTTLYPTLLTAFGVMLSKYARQEDLVVGTPVAGRTHADFASVIGMFVNTLALRLRPEAEKTVAQAVAETHELVLGALDRADYPFDLLAEKVEWERNGSRSPLFDVMFVLQNTEQGTGAVPNLPALDVTPALIEGQMVKCDLTLDARETEDGLLLQWEYRTNLFRRETVEAMARHFVELLRDLTCKPNARLHDLAWVTDEEKRLILTDFNDTAYDYDRNRTLTDVFEQQVRTHPDRVAARFGEDALTYHQLNESANRLAHALQAQGIGPDRVVGVLMDRSLEMIVGILGILKAGGAYMPILPSYPQERIRYLLEDSGAGLVLTQKRWESLLAFYDGGVLALDDLSFADRSGENPERVAGPEHLAYVIYTSGSTGQPKGVMIEHRSVINRIEWMVEAYGIDERDVVLQKTPVVFDVSVWELFIWMFVGGEVCFLQPDGEKEPDVILEAIERHGVTVMHFVPSMLNVFLDALEGSAVTSSRLQPLRRVFASGEALHAKQVNRFNRLIAAASQATLNNLYGPTEATVDVSYFNCATDREVATVPIGKPIRNLQLYVVDSALRLQPIGVPGELCIAGEGLARGYRNKPELTAEKFLTNPFGPGRLYRTGDLARWMPDGNIEYHGRIDHQVKIRGYRIELGEIETRLLEHASVSEAVVIDREEATGDRYLAAYVVGTDDLNVSALRAHLLERLPDYMVPAYFVKLDAMPVTANGKADRKALPEPAEMLQVTVDYVEPQTELEKVIAEVWREVLDLPQIGLHDHFFDLGGHSLKAVQIIARLYDLYGIKLEVKDLFLQTTVHRLANLLADKLADGERQERVPLTRGPQQDAYLMSNAQRRLWFLDQLIEGDTSYIVPFGAYLHGTIDREHFAEAWDMMFRRHESLRTLFREVDGQPRAIIQDTASGRPEVHDLRDYDPEAAEAWIQELVEVDQATPFDLGNGPLVRLKLFRLEDEKFYFYMNMHHIITDGWSNGVLFQEFATVYAALRDGQSIRLPELPVAYTDYAAWEERVQNDVALQQKEQYLLHELRKPLPSLQLPLDYDRFELQRYKGSSVSFDVDADLLARLHAVARKHQASLFMVTLTAYFILLRHLTQQDDIIVGFPSAGRVHPDLEHMVGFFVNTLVVRVRFEEAPDVKALLEQVKEKCLKAYEHQDYPFDLLVKKVNPERELDRSAIFSTMFAMQNYARHQEHRAFEFTSAEVAEKTSRFDLTLTASEEEGRLHVALTYNIELFTEQTVRTFGEQYVMVLRYLEEVLS
ncbi:MAG TPA: amino acid adenylation domain-containing protein [Bacilli bacterium]|nr:amino acid adenylation domain-containing protein [Bacilli bacterium]